MSDILHKISIEAPKEKVYDALATIDGLSKWWTKTTDGESTPGGTIDFRFGGHVSSMQVQSLTPHRRVEWKCVREQPKPDSDWIGTKVTFDLSEENGKTVLRFGHRDWREANDFFAHCSTKWATFLLSLKGLAENGQGTPFPEDTRI